MWFGPGEHVVAHVPVAGPVPPPYIVVMPEAMASRASCGHMKCTWASRAPAVNMRPSPAMASVPTPTTRSCMYRQKCVICISEITTRAMYIGKMCYNI